jgi:thiosulfate dehydrogenase [quinone] large subunit
MTDLQENERLARRLAETYALRIPNDVIASALTGRPKLPILLSRASFRADVNVRTNQRAQISRDRRNFLRGALALGVISAATLLLRNLESNSQPSSTTQPTGSANIASVPNNPVVQVSQPAANAQAIANASSIPLDGSLIYNDPSLGPIILIHLDNGKFVAYSAICTHAGCQVQFDPSLKDIVCPCHGAVYDPYHNAQVIQGPAPYPLQNVPIQYNQSTGYIYLSG